MFTVTSSNYGILTSRSPLGQNNSRFSVLALNIQCLLKRWGNDTVITIYFKYIYVYITYKYDGHKAKTGG